jgi:hypothetical protein
VGEAIQDLPPQPGFKMWVKTQVESDLDFYGYAPMRKAVDRLEAKLRSDIEAAYPGMEIGEATFRFFQDIEEGVSG